ncbi:MAG: NAD(P)-dependent oxidoreductase [Alphaproteobacteria bacterium]|nr:NAD(P)-dependent oxidoreductase [Alphaproteobacteria bacterium]
MITPQNIALIGCGLMGHGIALNLLRAGHRVSILNHPGNQPTDDLAPLGADLVDGVARLVTGKDAVFLVLPGSPEVEAVVMGRDGVLAHAQGGLLIVDATTAEPTSTERVAAAARAKGCAYVDAPMTRTPREAEAGRLNVLVGGAATDVERARPLIQCYAEHIHHGGGVGAGHRLKLLHNFASIGHAVILAESFAAARRGGVDLNVLAEVLASGGAGGAALDRLRPFVERGDSSAFRFAVKNAAKDMDYYARMTADLDAGAAAAAGVRNALTQALATAHPDAVMPELVDIFGQITK